MNAWLSLASALICTALFTPRPAHACGGTFCDGPGSRVNINVMTVDQSGENILFVRGEGYIEAHVQIRYEGEPDKFAWLVPMPSVPEVEIGSQPLLDALLWDSQPRYGIRTTRMSCDGEITTTESSGCAAAADGGALATGRGDRDEESSMMMDPIGKTVGSFDVTILQPDSEGEILEWLMENDFDLPERSEELIAPYVDQGAAFVAIRLVPGSGVQEIHPIVFRFEGDTAAIPIQLTAVAATEDMRIRTFFLGEERTVPTNYQHVELNDAKLNWPTFASNYEQVVARAVDEASNGHAFITEYAGSSAIIDDDDIHREQWEAEAFAELSPQQALVELEAQGQIDCAAGICVFPHPLVLPLLQRYIPAPAGVGESAFYSCLECFAQDIDSEAWDAQAFANSYQERVIDPGLKAKETLANSRYLTRMISAISPDEMTLDPAFHENPDLPSVSQEHWAERTIPCRGEQTLRLPDGRVVTESALPLDWVGNDADMPNAESISVAPRAGEFTVIRTQSDRIDVLVSEWNANVQSSIEVDIETEIRGRDRSSRRGCAVQAGTQQRVGLIGLTAAWLAWRRRRRSRG